MRWCLGIIVVFFIGILQAQIGVIAIQDTSEIAYFGSGRGNDLILKEGNPTDFFCGINEYPVLDVVLSQGFSWKNVEVNINAGDFVKLSDEIINDSTLRIRLFSINSTSLDSIVLSHIWIHHNNNLNQGLVSIETPTNNFLNGLVYQKIHYLKTTIPEPTPSFINSAIQNSSLCYNYDTVGLAPVYWNELYSSGLKYIYQKDSLYRVYLELSGSDLRFDTLSPIEVITNNINLIGYTTVISERGLQIIFKIRDYELLNRSTVYIALKNIRVIKQKKTVSPAYLLFKKDQSEIYFHDQIEDTLASLRMRNNPIHLLSNLNDGIGFCANEDSYYLTGTPLGGNYEVKSDSGEVTGYEIINNKLKWKGSDLRWNNTMIPNQSSFNFNGNGNDYKPYPSNSKNILIRYSYESQQCYFDSLIEYTVFGSRNILDPRGELLKIDSLTRFYGIDADTLGVSLYHGWNEWNEKYWISDSSYFQSNGLLNGFYKGSAVSNDYFYPMTHFIQNRENPWALIQFEHNAEPNNCPAVFGTYLKVNPPPYYYDQSLWMKSIHPGSLDQICQGEDSLIIWFRRDTLINSFETLDEDGFYEIPDISLYQINTPLENRKENVNWALYYYDIDSIKIENTSSVNIQLIDQHNQAICTENNELPNNKSYITDTCGLVFNDSIKSRSGYWFAINDWISTPQNKALKYQIDISQASDSLHELKIRIYYKQHKLKLDSLRERALSIETSMLSNLVSINLNQQPKKKIENLSEFYCGNSTAPLEWDMQGDRDAYFLFDIDSSFIREIDINRDSVHQLPSGTHLIQAHSEFQNSGCQSIFFESLNIYPKQEVDIIADRGLCMGNTVVFHSSLVDTNSVNYWVWNSDTTIQKDSIIVEIVDTLNTLKLEVEMLYPLGSCKIEKKETLASFKQPKASYVLKGLCDLFPLRLENTSYTDLGSGDYIDSLKWFVDGQMVSQDTILSGHQLEDKQVMLEVKTAAGCDDTVTKRIKQIKTYEISIGQAYYEDFEDGVDWVAAEYWGKSENSSWSLDFHPGSMNNRSRFWMTSIDSNDSYLSHQQSSIFSPCFNMFRSEYPILNFDLGLDCESEMDGLVLEYSKCTSEDDINGLVWKRFSSADQQLNWYNSNYIYSKPGDSTDFYKGWTGSYIGMRRVAISLRNVINLDEDSLIIFRYSFASNDGNPPSKNWLGAGIDNFSLRPKQNEILMEYFSNTDFKNHHHQLQAFTAGDLNIKTLNIPTEFPIRDSLFSLAPDLYSSRALRYGINEGPNVVLNGSWNKDKEHFLDSLRRQINLISISGGNDELSYQWINTEGKKDSILVQLPINYSGGSTKYLMAYVTVKNGYDDFRENILLTSLNTANGINVINEEELVVSLEKINELPENQLYNILLILQDIETNEVEAIRWTDEISTSELINLQNKEGVQIYPNPFYYRFNLQSAQLIDHLEVFDLSGGQVRVEQIDDYSFCLPNARSGWYLVKIYGKERVVSKWIYQL